MTTIQATITGEDLYRGILVLDQMKETAKSASVTGMGAYRWDLAMGVLVLAEHASALAQLFTGQPLMPPKSLGDEVDQARKLLQGIGWKVPGWPLAPMVFSNWFGKDQNIAPVDRSILGIPPLSAAEQRNIYTAILALDYAEKRIQRDTFYPIKQSLPEDGSGWQSLPPLGGPEALGGSLLSFAPQLGAGGDQTVPAQYIVATVLTILGACAIGGASWYAVESKRVEGDLAKTTAALATEAKEYAEQVAASASTGQPIPDPPSHVQTMATADTSHNLGLMLLGAAGGAAVTWGLVEAFKGKPAPALASNPSHKCRRRAKSCGGAKRTTKSGPCRRRAKTCRKQWAPSKKEPPRKRSNPSKPEPAGYYRPKFKKVTGTTSPVTTKDARSRSIDDLEATISKHWRKSRGKTAGWYILQGPEGHRDLWGRTKSARTAAAMVKQGWRGNDGRKPPGFKTIHDIPVRTFVQRNPKKKAAKKAPAKGRKNPAPKAHKSAPKRYRELGATRASDYAWPEGFKFPLVFRTKSGSVKKKLTEKHIRAAASRCGQYCAHYPPKVRATIRRNICAAAAKYGVDVSDCKL